MKKISFLFFKFFDDDFQTSQIHLAKNTQGKTNFNIINYL